jgi:myotubularin-related protein 5/13
MDALPEQLNHWQANALYIIGDKPVLQDIPEDLYPNCTFVPVEVRKSYI